MIPNTLKALSIDIKASIRKAMQVIDQGSCEIAFVISSEGKLIGTLTDGDIRRAILAGTSLDEPASSFMRKDFTSVTEEISRADVLDLMKARFMQQIPVVDKSGRFIGLHLLREIIGAASRENWAVIMAGGRGERLRPLTDNLPKPMINVAGRPILERIVLHLVGFGIRRIFLSVNYLGEIIQKHFGDGSAFGCRIEYLWENQPLGSGGSLSLLSEQPIHPFLVLNGDLITNFDVDRMFRFHASENFKATVAIHEYLHTVPYGVVEASASYVKNIQEKPTQVWMANAGIYIFEPHLVDRIPQNTFFPLPALIEECLERGEPVGAFHLENEWADIGRKEDLQKACGKT